MFRRFNFAIFPFLTCLAASASNASFAIEPAQAEESERTLSSWNIAYSSGRTGSDKDGLGPLGAVHSVTMRRNEDNYDIFFHYTRCHMCAAMQRKASYFTIDEEKAQQITALVDEGQIKAALERPCTLPSARARLNKVTVRLDPPPAGYAPFSYDILLGCQSAELNEVKANLDAAIDLFAVWMEEHENQSKQ